MQSELQLWQAMWSMSSNHIMSCNLEIVPSHFYWSNGIGANQNAWSHVMQLHMYSYDGYGCDRQGSLAAGVAAC